MVCGSSLDLMKAHYVWEVPVMSQRTDISLFEGAAVKGRASLFNAQPFVPQQQVAFVSVSAFARGILVETGIC